MKGTVVFQFVDLLFSPISGLEHKIENEKGKVIASGLSNSNGKTVVISRDLGACLKVFVKKINSEYKFIGLYYVYKEGDVKIFRSPKVLINNLKKYEKNDQAGTAKPFTYTIKKDDKLINIAKKYNTTVALLCGLNKIKDANKIYIGQKIQVHPNYSAKSQSKNDADNSTSNNVVGSNIYKVKSGDTLSEISLKTGVSVNQLKLINNIFDIHEIYAGQLLKLNNNTPSTPSTLNKAIIYLPNFITSFIYFSIFIEIIFINLIIIII